MSKLVRMMCLAFTVVTGAGLAQPAGAAVIRQGTPVSVSIPTIHVSARVDRVTFNHRDILPGPSRPGRIAWYQHGAKPGQTGNVFMLGHLDSYAGRAVLWNLRQLQTGDRIFVETNSGRRFTYRVAKSQTLPWHRVPVNRLAHQARGRTLTLLTCAGIWSRTQRNYSHRLIVTADEVSSRRMAAAAAK